MPNYVKNIVRFDKSVPDSEFLSFLSRVMAPKEGGAALPASAEAAGDEGETATHAITVRDFGNMGLDFNTLVPMPKALDITSGSDTDEGLLLSTVGTDCSMGGPKMTLRPNTGLMPKSFIRTPTNPLLRRRQRQPWRFSTAFTAMP